jgi:hypothetical protein
MWKFLDLVYSQTQFVNHPWWEQAAIRMLIDSGRGPERMKYADKILMNAYPNDFKPRYSAIIHVPGDPRFWPDRIGELNKHLSRDAV